MMVLPTGSRGQAMAAALLLVVLVAAGFVGNGLMALHAANAERIAGETALLARTRRLSADLPALRAHAAGSETAAAEADGPAAASLFLPGSSDAVAAAGIQARLAEAIATHGGTLMSTTNTPPEADGDALRRIGVRVQFAGTLPALVAVLRQVATAQPALFVDGLEIQSGTENDPSLALGNARRLDIALTVHGLRAAASGGAGRAGGEEPP
jgi:hypothetical protein